MDHEEKTALLYQMGAASEYLPDGFVVVGSSNCMLCKQSMLNNDYPTETAAGAPIVWLNLDDPEANRVFHATPGITYTDTHILVAEQPLTAYPAIIWVEGRQVKRPVVKYGEVAPGGFEQLLEKLSAA
jgi:hypothetical protein